MCHTKFIESELTVPGQEPILDEQFEDICYDKFQELARSFYDFIHSTLYFENFNEILHSSSSEMRSIVMQIEKIMSLPETEVQFEDLDELTRRVNYSFKKNEPDPMAKSFVSKATFLSEVTIERIKS